MLKFLEDNGVGLSFLFTLTLFVALILVAAYFSQKRHGD
jgi:hypothetical protein